MKVSLCTFSAEPHKKNRYYVVDTQGNKIYYGTKYQCEQFKQYMKGVLDYVPPIRRKAL